MVELSIELDFQCVNTKLFFFKVMLRGDIGDNLVTVLVSIIFQVGKI